MTYRMDDGTVVKTENASRCWNEKTYFDGHNQISVNTHSQWTHETLLRSRRGRYWIEHSSQYQGARSSAEWISNRQAAAWLLLNEHEVLDELKAVAEEVEE